MALPNIDQIELQYLDIWFSNIVDTMNYDLGLIQNAVPALTSPLITLDTAPIQYLRDSFDKLTNVLNQGFEQIYNEIESLKSRVSALENKGG
jgi:hypothetical protein